MTGEGKMREPGLLEELEADAPDSPATEAGGPEHQYCVFRAGRERFCIPMAEVEEVVEWPKVTRIPLSAPFLLGIFNLRGSIVPVIDIAFTPSPTGDAAPRHVVVGLLSDKAEAGPTRVGIVADEVIGTHSTRDALLYDQKPSDVPHCCGMLRYEDKLALALDLRRVAEVFPVRLI
jgi:purine-binding chemotaxis protein CheW